MKVTMTDLFKDMNPGEVRTITKEQAKPSSLRVAICNYGRINNCVFSTSLKEEGLEVTCVQRGLANDLTA